MLAAAPPHLHAQLKSVPVYALTGERAAWVVALDYGAGLNRATGHARHLGGRLSGVAGRLQLTVAGGLWDAGTSSAPQLGAMTGVRLMGNGSGTVTLHGLAGVGYVRVGPSDAAATYVTVPLGVALVRPGLAVFRASMTPWIAPRFEVHRTSFGPVRVDQSGVGGSAGVAARLVGRMGVHGALDCLYLLSRSSTGISETGGLRWTLGLGIHLALSRAS